MIFSHRETTRVDLDKAWDKHPMTSWNCFTEQKKTLLSSDIVVFSGVCVNQPVLAQMETADLQIQM